MVNNMRKNKYLILIIFLLTLTFCLSSCDKTKKESLTKTLEQEIILEFERSYEDSSEKGSQLYIVEYYGNYNGAHIFFIDTKNALYSLPPISKITIETKIEGEHSGWISLEKSFIKLFGYYDGLIYTIDKLHSAGFITTEEVLDIWNRYCEKEHELRYYE